MSVLNAFNQNGDVGDVMARWGMRNQNIATWSKMATRVGIVGLGMVMGRHIGSDVPFITSATRRIFLKLFDAFCSAITWKDQDVEHLHE